MKIFNASLFQLLHDQIYYHIPVSVVMMKRDRHAVTQADGIKNSVKGHQLCSAVSDFHCSLLSALSPCATPVSLAALATAFATALLTRKSIASGTI